MCVHAKNKRAALSQIQVHFACLSFVATNCQLFAGYNRAAINMHHTLLIYEMYMEEQNNENPALYNASKNISADMRLKNTQSFQYWQDPVDWREIFMKQSVGKCKQINF